MKGGVLMQISSINSYSNYAKYNKNSTSVPNFRGGLSDAQYNQVLNKLKAVSTKKVIEGFSDSKIKAVVAELSIKYSCLGINKVSIQIISEKDLPGFLGDQACKYDLAGKLGLCVAVGDKNAPVEHLNNIYETVTLIANSADFK